MKHFGTIYVLESIDTGHVYVGQTTRSVEERIAGHKHDNYVIGKAIRKYGIERFNIKKYEYIRTDWLDWFECEMIKHYNCIVPNGYNIMHGGQKNRFLNAESILKMSIALRGRTAWNKGIPMKPEAKEKMIKSKTGIKLSEETKRKMSESAKKVVHTEEWNKHVSDAQIGKTIPDEQREKIRKKLLGVKQSDERKARHSQIMKDWWAKRKASQGG